MTSTIFHLKLDFFVRKHWRSATTNPLACHPGLAAALLSRFDLVSLGMFVIGTFRMSLTPYCKKPRS